MAWLLGTDTHHARSKNERWCGQFSIVKATEGSTFVDPEFKKIVTSLSYLGRQFDYPLGVYHFLSHKSRIGEQIAHFVSTVEPLKGRVMLALDYEGGFADSDPSGKCLTDAIEQLRMRTRAQIVVYMNKSEAGKIYTRQFNEIVAAPDVCLWLADYTGTCNVKWKPIMRQVCSSPCDINVFYGSAGSFMDIARSWK